VDPAGETVPVADRIYQEMSSNGIAFTNSVQDGSKVEVTTDTCI